MKTPAANTSYFLSSPGAFSFPVPPLSETCLALIFLRLPEVLNFQEKGEL